MIYPPQCEMEGIQDLLGSGGWEASRLDLPRPFAKFQRNQQVSTNTYIHILSCSPFIAYCGLDRYYTQITQNGHGSTALTNAPALTCQ